MTLFKFQFPKSCKNIIPGKFLLRYKNVLPKSEIRNTLDFRSQELILDFQPQKT